MKKIVSLAFLAFAMSSCSAQITEEKKVNTDAKEQVCERVDAAKFKEGIAKGDVQILDVRTPEECSEGKIDNAVNINFYDKDFIQKVESTLKKDVPVYVYCRSGGRSQKAMQTLRDLGFAVIYELQGGYMSY